MCMTNNKQANPSLPNRQSDVASYHLHQIINSDPILSEYFRMNCPKDRYYSMAHQLMLDGIRYRTNANICDRECCCKNGNLSNIPQQTKVNVMERQIQQIQHNKIRNSPNQKKIINTSNQKNKHDNVAYIKHNRFLSPKQKKQIVTPKVTEIIPVKSQPLIIYGKPRVKVDNQFGCPYHNNQEECLAIPYGSCQPQTPRQNGRQIHIRQKTNSQHKEKNFSPDSTKKYNELSKYKSTPNLIKEIDRRELPQELNKTKKNYKKPQKKQKNGRENFTKEVPGQTIYVDRIIQVQSRVPGKMRNVQSPKSRTIVEQYDPSYSENQNSYLVSRYDSREVDNQRSRGQQTKREIQSKIKFLIDRDKKNKALQKHMKKQEQRINHLQLIMKSQKQQKKEKPKVKIQANDILSLSSSSSSDMTLLNPNVISKFKKKGNSGRKEKLEVQSDSKSFNQKGSARFGVKDQILNENMNIQFENQSNCSCSKTLNNDSEQSSINPNDQSGQSEPFSDFHG